MVEIVLFSVLELLALSVIPVLYRTIVAGDTGVDFCLGVAVRALIDFAVDVTMVAAHAVCLVTKTNQ